MYRIALPERRLPAGSLSVETSARVFQRSVQVGVVRPADRNRREAAFDALTSTTWRHTDEQAVSLQRSRSSSVRWMPTELWLVVDEGDNAPLPLSRARLLLPSYRLRFLRRRWGLRLLYGREDLQPPRYDLSLLAPKLMGARDRGESRSRIVACRRRAVHFAALVLGAAGCGRDRPARADREAREASLRL